MRGAGPQTGKPITVKSMADSSQGSHGKLEHINAPDTSVLHAPTHMVSSEMTRGYLVEHSFPLPTKASEPQQLLKLEVLGLFRKQDSPASPGHKLQGDHLFYPSRNTLSKLKTRRRERRTTCLLLKALKHCMILDCHERNVVKSKC